MTCYVRIYNYVDQNYDVIIPYTHNTAHVIILPLEIIIIIHYIQYSPYIIITHSTITYYTYRLCTFKVLFINKALRLEI